MIGALVSEGRRLLAREYPDFVAGQGSASLDEGYLPVFTFHTLEPGDFEAKLRRLSDDGYRTISLDRALAHVRGDERAPPRSVVLTIDDGRLSTWTVGCPLLRRHGMCAAAFVIPGFADEGPPRPTLDDGDATGGTGRPLTEERDAATALRWSEIERLHASDAISVQSHTWTHRRVTVSRRLRGFVTPDAARARYDLPAPADASTPGAADDRGWTLGAPIFEHAPILSRSSALEPPDALMQTCADRVRRGGGEAFFRRAGWRRELRSLVEGFEGEFRVVGLEPHQRREVVAAREALERRLGASAARHLCLPSGEGSEPAVRLARKCGHASMLWGHVPESGSNRPGSDPFRIGRLKHDYIARLPGSGRRSLAAVLAAKTVRRLHGRTGY